MPVKERGVAAVGYWWPSRCRWIPAVLGAFLLLCGPPEAAAQSVERTLDAAPRWAASPGFERPAGLADEIGFWVRIYSQVTTRGGLVHDDRHLAVVYEQLDFPERSSNAERRHPCVEPVSERRDHQRSNRSCSWAGVLDLDLVNRPAQQRLLAKQGPSGRVQGSIPASPGPGEGYTWTRVGASRLPGASRCRGC